MPEHSTAATENSNSKISYFKLLAACVYELLLLIALWFISAWIFVVLFGDATQSYKRLLLQICLWLVTGAYFVWCWRKSGQTLATQTWRMQLVNQSGAVLSTQQAMLRYVLASASASIFGLGFLWALVDRNRLYLHDRILKTHFVQLEKIAK
ncbi:MAG: RDD family protein [Pseudomonadota bacterium]